jgi:hypothetical protein
MKCTLVAIAASSTATLTGTKGAGGAAALGVVATLTGDAGGDELGMGAALWAALPAALPPSQPTPSATKRPSELAGVSQKPG